MSIEIEIHTLPVSNHTNDIRDFIQKTEADISVMKNNLELKTKQLTELHTLLRRKKENQVLTLQIQNPDVIVLVSKRNKGVYRYREYTIHFDEKFKNGEGAWVIGNNLYEGYLTKEDCFKDLLRFYDKPYMRDLPDFSSHILEYCPKCRGHEVRNKGLELTHCPACGINLKEAYERAEPV